MISVSKEERTESNSKMRRGAYPLELDSIFANEKVKLIDKIMPDL
jgi:hypothetical protein